MGTKVPLITAVHVHNQRIQAADPQSHKPNSDGHKPDHNGPSTHHLSHSHHTATGSSYDIVAGVNGLSNGFHTSQSSLNYGSTGALDKFGVTRMLHPSPERQRRNSMSLLNCVPEDGTMDSEYDLEEGSRFVGGASIDGDEEEEEELELDEELAAEGLYRGEAFIDRHALQQTELLKVHIGDYWDSIHSCL
jgi:hypothetical protein